jgi:plasmid stabilization system protein ParE
MNYTVVVRAAAQHDAAEAYLWYEVRSVGLGVRFADALQACLDRLARNPKLQKRQGAFRHAIVEKFPYRVVFVIEGSTVFVYQIRHTSRNPSKRFGP